MKLRDRLKSRRVIAALVAVGLTVAGGSVALTPGVTEIVCALVGCL